MIALIQRVAEANVIVGGQTVGAIGRGILALVGVECGDGEAEAARLVERVLTYRVFPDEEGKMNRSLLDVQGGLLAVSQFTLVADTKSGTRPGFSRGAAPAEGKKAFELFLDKARTKVPGVQAGVYGADMKVTLVNDGPVTFWLQVPPRSAA